VFLIDVSRLCSCIQNYCSFFVGDLKCVFTILIVLTYRKYTENLRDFLSRNFKETPHGKHSFKLINLKSK